MIAASLRSTAGPRAGFRFSQHHASSTTTGLGYSLATRVPEPEPSRSFVVPGLARRIEVKIASTQDEFEQAFLLLSAKYRARGYEVPSDKPFRFTPFHVLPRTSTFVAKHGKQVVATLSLVPDNQLLGLPLEGLYGSEIAGLRRAGSRIAEATSLADRDLSTTEFLQVFLSMIKLLMQSHVRGGGDCWVITVNPRHAAFYRRMLGFRRLGPRRSYDVVQGHPAEAYVLDVASMQQRAPKMYEDMLSDPLPDDVLMAPPRPATHARYFGARSTQVDRSTIRTILRLIEREHRPGTRAGYESGKVTAREQIEACGV